MAAENDVDAAKVRALDKLTALLEVLTRLARAGLEQLEADAAEKKGRRS